MYKKVEILTKENKNLKIKPIKDYNYAKNITNTIITVDEFYEASKSLPIFFISNNERKEAVSILGIKKNNFVDENGKWKEYIYIPAYIRRYPFIFIEHEGKLILGYDKESDTINEKDGEKLFDKKGNPTQYTKRVMEFMENYQISYKKTELFISKLEELNLLKDIVINIGENKLTGIKQIDEEKLNNLEDDKILELVKNGYYKLIVSHLISISNIKNIKE